jgi:hypothetical protein
MGEQGEYLYSYNGNNGKHFVPDLTDSPKLHIGIFLVK